MTKLLSLPIRVGYLLLPCGGRRVSCYDDVWLASNAPPPMREYMFYYLDQSVDDAEGLYC